MKSLFFVAILGLSACGKNEGNINYPTQHTDDNQPVSTLPTPTPQSCIVIQLDGGALIQCPDGSTALIQDDKGCKHKERGRGKKD